MKLALAIVGGLALAACGGTAPDISLPDSNADLGEVVNGEIVAFEIPVHNIGDGELVIEAVSTSCGCTTANLSPELIPAGGSGTLAITYDSGAHGPNEIGPVMRQIFIASNDPDEPEFEFRFTANVVTPPP